MANKKQQAIEFEDSSGNVFADLGLSNPEERLIKAELAIRIRRLIKDRRLTQAAAARLLEIDQPKISMLVGGKLSGFSLERLFRFLYKLGQNITICVEDAQTIQGRPHLVVTYPQVQEKNCNRIR
jgi:predicted XRE-type DNA-binding protein